MDCVGFMVGGAGACSLVGGDESFLSDGQGCNICVFWGFCELSKTLVSLSAHGLGWVPAFLVV